MILSLSELPGLIDAMQGKRVLIVGDVMLDVYLFGEATRISPEAPVPVVHISAERHVLGGAGNVARNIAALGGKPTLIGLVGRDGDADRLKTLLAEECIAYDLIESPTRRTTVKTRLLAGRQQVVRMDKEDAGTFTENELHVFLTTIGRHMSDYDVVVISDYAKGFMSTAMMKGLSDVIHASGKTPHILVDPKPANIGLYSNVTVLTPNTREAGECAGISIRSKEDILAAGASILDRTNTRYLLTTLGPDGMALFDGKTKVWHIPTFAQKVFDVTGAGDTVIATLSLAMAAKGGPLPSCVLANAAAGLVVASVGAATVTSDQLRTAVSDMPDPILTRWQ